MKLDKGRVIPIIRSALKEDIGKGDITTGVLIDKFDSANAAIVVNEDCVICGMDIAEWTVSQVDYSVRFKPNCKDADEVVAGKEVAFIEGHLGSILRAERTVLNFLSFLSGIATSTKKFVDIAAPYGVKVMDTRKTLPLLRYLEKYAVFTGGGSNHRMGLYDQVLIKDNHIKAQSSKLKAQSGPIKSRIQNSESKYGLKDLVDKARKGNIKGTVIEIEVTGIEEFKDAISGKPDIIMLDNMTIADVKACVDIRKAHKAKPLLEVSGGIRFENIEEYARAKVDMISIGSLTSSVKSIDMSLEVA
jgi:nicotinate-nucleotide pyrophosphorylase (carboxylating)